MWADPGIELLVQAEFLVQDPRRRDEINPQTGRQQQQQDGGQGGKKKHKGQNKKRPPPVQFNRKDQLCPQFADVTSQEDWPECVFPGCVFMHDVKAFLDKKGPDLGEECVVFKTLGRCPRGLTCRFGGCHISIDGDKYRNMENKALIEKLSAEGVQVLNKIKHDLKTKLRKKELNFEKCDVLVDRIFKEREQAQQMLPTNSKTENGDKNEAIDTIPEVKKPKLQEDVKSSVNVEEGITAVEGAPKKKIDWTDKLYLAPLTTVGNLPFRRICKSFGVDITCGEMAMAQQLLQGHLPEWALVQRHSSEDLYGIQVCGNSPQQMARLATVINENVDCDFVDINLGCPIDLVYKRGMGSALMGRKKPLEVMTRAMSQILHCPLTIKMRTGIYMDKRIAHNLIPCVKEWGASMVTLHGRSREQRYTRLADWNYIGECVKIAGEMPIYGNGDIINFEDYERCKASGASGVMVARGALIKPWVFTEIKERRHWDISAQERLDMIHSYCNYGLEHWGSDSKGVENTRRFLLEWLSFLHRYVPHGILERPPQSINQRVPFYQGRNDLETLLSSPNCADWVKITEMFLGKVPENFAFEPKHRAHAYQ